MSASICMCVSSSSSCRSVHSYVRKHYEVELNACASIDAFLCSIPSMYARVWRDIQRRPENPVTVWVAKLTASSFDLYCMLHHLYDIMHVDRTERKTNAKLTRLGFHNILIGILKGVGRLYKVWCW